MMDSTLQQVSFVSAAQQGSFFSFFVIAPSLYLYYLNYQHDLIKLKIATILPRVKRQIFMPENLKKP